MAPAGGEDALRAAVQSGADAVYLGGERFGARAGAANFTIADMEKYARYCHLYGVDVHAAVNTLIKEKEIPDFAEYIEQLGGTGVDAVIVQDIGAARIIKSILPDMPLHASTQMTVTSLDGVKYLEDMGFSRVVLARELSKKEIEYIAQRAKAEIEVFVHGAICMCYSGQCLMSSILGGRSGNRGRCAQPCRLMYELLENGGRAAKGYLLSPKDMSLIAHLNELESIGVRSLKIEGRLKRAEYVSAVVGIYRKYLDCGGSVSEEDMRELTDAFSRSGFTDGYFTARLGAEMMSGSLPGNSGENKFGEEAKRRAAPDANIRKIPITMTASAKLHKPLGLTISDRDGNSVSVTGTLNAEKALKTPLDRERLKEQLLKLGSTPFKCVRAEIEADDGITVPIREINAVRRETAERLTELRSRADVKRINKFSREKLTHGDTKLNNVGDTKLNNFRDTKMSASDACGDTKISVEVFDTRQLEAALLHNADRIYVPTRILKMSSVRDILKSASERGIEIAAKMPDIPDGTKPPTDSVLVSSPAAARACSEKKLYGDFRLNVFNSVTLNSFSQFDSVTLSPELNLREAEDILSRSDVKAEIIVYGRLPLMIMKNCPVKAAGKCVGQTAAHALRDRKNEIFPIVCSDGCRAVLLNSKPIFMADKASDLKKLKINSMRLIFTVENFSQCGKIIDVYRRALLDGESVSPMEENTYTRGHFYRGVL